MEGLVSGVSWFEAECVSPYLNFETVGIHVGLGGFPMKPELWVNFYPHKPAAHRGSHIRESQIAGADSELALSR